MDHHVIGGISVSVRLGPHNDSDIGLVVKAKEIPVGISPSGVIGAGGTIGGFGITIKESTNAEIIRHWPSVSILDPDRRKVVYQTAKNALSDAEEANVASVGFYTMALEVARVPSWEIAEELVKAVYEHSKDGCGLENVILVASSPTQVSSFQFALNNIKIIRGT
ncbi:MAG: hypothetical protein JW779_06140 [Candidatus Thorarchaeota archaeon]|nr:hypothetical protein [Candidatus Thorarchaeota archaeon]